MKLMYLPLAFFCMLLLVHMQDIQSQNLNFFNKKINTEAFDYYCTNSVVLDESIPALVSIGMFVTSNANFIYANHSTEIGDLHTIGILSTSDLNYEIPQGVLFDLDRNGNFFVAYSEKDSNTPENFNIALMKFDIDNSVIFQKTYADSNTKDTPSFVLNTENNGFLLGGTKGTDSNASFLVIKTDENGNEQWTKEYGTAAVCHAAKATNDGNYLLLGTQETEENGKQMYLIEINSSGDKVWEKMYGGTEDEEGLRLTVLPKEEENTGFLLVGTQLEGGVNKHYYVRLKEDKTLAWEKTYYQEGLGPMKTDVLPAVEGNSFIGAANIEVDGIYEQPIVIHITNSGTVDWTSNPTPKATADVIVTDIDATHNENGYLLTGYQNHPSPVYGWIATIDFEGNYCEPLGCDSTAVVTDIESSWVSPEIKIVPNPSSKDHQVRYNLSQGAENATFDLYDLTGKKVKSATLEAGQESHSLATSHLKAGAYFYSISYKGKRVASGKLLIE